MKRVDVLREIAERYYELMEPCGRSGVVGSDDRVPLMPATYTPSVREFERLLTVMRRESKQRTPIYAVYHDKAWRFATQQLYRDVRVSGRVKTLKVELATARWHLLEWHIGAERIRRLEPVTVIAHGKRRQMRNQDGTLRTRPVLIVRRHRDARLDRAELALAWMAANWGLSSEPMLPSEVFQAAAA